jgi:hypothetical protein
VGEGEESAVRGTLCRCNGEHTNHQPKPERLTKQLAAAGHLQHFHVLAQPRHHLPRLHLVKEQGVTRQQGTKEAAAQAVGQALPQR